MWLWVRALTNTVLRQDSLRRRSNKLIDASLGSRGRVAYVWNSYPRVTTFSVAFVAVVVGFLVPGLHSLDSFISIAGTKPSLIAVVTGLWGVEAILFALTAGVTALLVNISADPDERSLLMERYRAKAFDAVAALSIVTILLTGEALREMLRAEVLNLDATEAALRTSLLFVFDLGGLGWLLYYSHRLITRAPRERTPNLLQLLRDSFREAALPEVSGGILESWGAQRGLAIVSHFGGFGQTPATVVATKTAYLCDVGLDRLELWLRSLRQTIEGQPQTRAQAQIRLNAEVTAGKALAATAPDDGHHAKGFRFSLRWKATMPADQFAAALGLLEDNAGRAARAGALGEFRLHLSELHALQSEVFRLSGGTRNLTSGWLTSLLGWQPTIQLRIALHRLGNVVLSTESVPLVGAWLYFPQKLLSETRQFTGRDLRSIYFLWEQAAGRGRVPDEWGFWLRLSEYNNSVNMGLAIAADAESLGHVAGEASGLLLSFRNMIVTLETPYFPRISQAVLRIGEHLVDAWSAARGVDNLTAARRQFVEQFLRLRRVFWLGYAGWLFRRLTQQRIPESEALKQWEVIRQQFNSLEELWQAWRVLGDQDPFQWDYEESRERRAEAEAQGMTSFGGFVDPFASTTLPLLLLAVNRAPAFALSPDHEAHALLQTEIQPHIAQILADGDAKWEPFVGRIENRSLADRMNRVKERIEAAGTAQAR